MLLLARALSRLGHEVVFAARDLRAATQLIGASFPCVAAPQAPAGIRNGLRQPATYSDILRHYSFRDAAVLGQLVADWHTLIVRTRTTLVVADHAPTAVLAARAQDLPCVLYGNGFSSPPRTAPLPMLRPWINLAPDAAADRESTVLQVANSVLRLHGATPMSRLSDLFDTTEDLLCTLPELDHYGPRTGVHYRGPVYCEEEGAVPQWPDAGGRRICVYVPHGCRAFAPLLRALQISGHGTLWIAPDLDAQRAAGYQSTSLRFAVGPLRLADVARQADLAVLNGGHGTVSAMLMHGVPMLLLPLHLEQYLLARNVSRLGAGMMLDPVRDRSGLGSALAHLLDYGGYREAAGRFAHDHRDFSPGQTVASAANRIGRLTVLP